MESDVLERRLMKIQPILEGVRSHKRKVLLVGIVSEDTEASRVEIKRIARDLITATDNGEPVRFD